MKIDCPHCDGKGYYIETPKDDDVCHTTDCPECAGSGEIEYHGGK